MEKLSEFAACLEQAEAAETFRFELAPGIDASFAVGVDSVGAIEIATVGINPSSLKPLLKEVRTIAYGSLPAGAQGGPLHSLISKAELVAAPLVYTAYNRRKHVVLRQVREALTTQTAAGGARRSAWSCLREEQRFMDALQAGPKALKWPEIWEHRRWIARAAVALDGTLTAECVSRIPGEMPLPVAADILSCISGPQDSSAGAREPSAGTAVLQTGAAAAAEVAVSDACLGTVLETELRAAASAAQRYSRNYAAWTTRRVLVAAIATLLQSGRLALAAGDPAGSSSVGSTAAMDVMLPRALTAASAGATIAASSCDAAVACLRFLIRQLGPETLASARLLGRSDMSLMNFRAGVLAAAVRCAGAEAAAASHHARVCAEAATSGTAGGCSSITRAVHLMLLAELLVLLPKFEEVDASVAAEADAAAAGVEQGMGVSAADCTSTTVNALLLWVGLAAQALGECGRASVDGSSESPAAAMLTEAVPAVRALCGVLRGRRAAGTVRARIATPIFGLAHGDGSVATAHAGLGHASTHSDSPSPAESARGGAAAAAAHGVGSTALKQAVLADASRVHARVRSLLSGSAVGDSGPSGARKALPTWGIGDEVSAAVASVVDVDIRSYCAAVCDA